MCGLRGVSACTWAEWPWGQRPEGVRVSGQDELRQLDEELAAGRVSAEEYRRRRDELRGEPPGDQPAPDPFPPPFSWNDDSPTTRVSAGGGEGEEGVPPGRQRERVGEQAGEVDPASGGEVEVVHPEAAGLAQDVVVDVGDVAHAARIVAEVAQPPLQHVVGEVDGGVADVGGVVGRDAARVHRHDRTGYEGDDLAARGVVQPHGRRVAGIAVGQGDGSAGASALGRRRVPLPLPSPDGSAGAAPPVAGVAASPGSSSGMPVSRTATRVL